MNIHEKINDKMRWIEEHPFPCQFNSHPTAYYYAIDFISKIDFSAVSLNDRYNGKELIFKKHKDENHTKNTKGYGSRMYGIAKDQEYTFLTNKLSEIYK